MIVFEDDVAEKGYNLLNALKKLIDYDYKNETPLSTWKEKKSDFDNWYEKNVLNNKGAK
jgi:hypothetical protein